MIQAHFRRNHQNHIVSFEMSGHADSGPYGSDIVCAAMSVLGIGTVNSLEKIGRFTPLVEADEEAGGYLYTALPDELTADQWNTAQVLLESFLLSSHSVSDEYPQYVVVREESE